MTIQNRDFIKLSYTGKLPDDRVFETTDESVAKENNLHNKNAIYGPVVVIVGAGHVLPGLDEDLNGKLVGYQGTVTFGPEKAFGARKLELIETVPVKKLGEKPAVGQTVNVGNKTGVIETLIGGRARVNFNHPLAGQNVTYDYKIEERLVSVEEKIKGLLSAFTGLKLEVKVDGSDATVKVPSEASLNSRLLFSKMQITNELFSRTDVKSISFVETFRKPEPPTPAATEVVEAPPAPETPAVKEEPEQK